MLSIFGTRPEAIKMAPVVRQLRECPGIESRICVTAQHRELLDPVLELFGLRPDHDLGLMRPGQDLYDVTAGALLGLREVLRNERPDRVLVHGDTTTCLAATLAAFYAGIPVAHVEAGLRTGSFAAPWPEEMNRTVVDRLSDLCFAPTEQARANLLRENVPQERVHVTGNTVVDALLWTRERVRADGHERWQTTFPAPLRERLAEEQVSSQRLIVVTGHRRENFEDGLRELCEAILRLARAHPDWAFVWPLHKNPRARDPVLDILGQAPSVTLLEALDYAPFVGLLDRASLVITDSGGVQEEATVLGTPALVTRTVTERTEALEAGGVRLVGTQAERIVDQTELVLGDDAEYARMASAHSPYGDGRAAQRIVDVLTESR